MTINKAAAAATKTRQALKNELGITSRQVSVRSDRDSINVTIKAPGIKIADVEAIARRQERIRMQDGDVLGGGNMFVSVSLDGSLTAEAGAVIFAWMESINDHRLHVVPGSEEFEPMSVHREDAVEFGLWDKPGCGEPEMGDMVASEIAARFVQAGKAVNPADFAV